jgi:hypothetical protein
MKTTTKKRLFVVTTAGAVAVLALLMFSAGHATGVARVARVPRVWQAVQRQIDETRAADEAARRSAAGSSASDTTNTIGEGSVAPSTAAISQTPLD